MCRTARARNSYWTACASNGLNRAGFADGAYARTKLLDKAVFRDFILKIVRRTDTEPGFKVLPRR